MRPVHTILESADGKSERYFVFTHGVLGTRRNWQSIAKRFVDARPGWGAVLVDLHEHGDANDAAPPHTLRSAATELDRVVADLNVLVGAVLGHSFGGKVVLQWLSDTNALADAGAHVFVIDSRIGAQPDASVRPPFDANTPDIAYVLEMLRTLPSSFDTRPDFIRRVIDAGFSESLAAWLGMNLQRTDGRTLRFGPRLDVIDVMLSDYLKRDLWSTFDTPPGSAHTHLVAAGRSTAVDAESWIRAQNAANHNVRVHTHTFPNAGHWVHVDAPDELINVLVESTSPIR